MLFCYFRYVCSREKSNADMQMGLAKWQYKNAINHIIMHSWDSKMKWLIDF